MRQPPRPPESWPPATLREAVRASGTILHGPGDVACLARAAPGLDNLAGASVLLRTQGQLAAALGLIALDGVARRIVIAPPDVKDVYLPSIVAQAAVDVVVGDDATLAVPGTRFVQLSMAHSLPLSAERIGGGDVGSAVPAEPAKLPDNSGSAVSVEPTKLPDNSSSAVPAEPTKLPTEGVSKKTEWVLFTSGTTGVPKMVAHTLAGLVGAIGPGTVQTEAAGSMVWSTFYDIRRYGGLQILLRALLGRTSLILSDADESVADTLTRLGRHGVTHLTGTPSHWRRVLMSPANAAITPRYVRLSGEIADQAVLDALKVRFPHAAIGHAYASTEAGVGFAVTDGLAGFPASYVGGPGPVEMKVEDGRLYLRSPRAASGYVGSALVLRHDGWVDSGDMVELRDDRYYFLGRAGGIINVGGLKISPEEVEAVINRQPGILACCVSGRKSPITGAIVVADVVLTDPANDNATFRAAILAACREALPSFKVPAMLRVVDHLELSANGKLCRGQGARHV